MLIMNRWSVSMHSDLVVVVGTVAALCTTLAFVPQIHKTWRTGGRDVSYPMLLVYLAGILLWLLYGVLISAHEVIFANVAATLIVTLNLGIKRLAERRVPTAAAAESGRKLRIAVDMDEVIADSLGKHIDAYNEAFGARLSAEDLAGKHLHHVVPAEHAEALQEIVFHPTFFEDLGVIEGSREVIRELAERHEVFIASAAMEVPTSFAAKYAWLREHFPFIPTSHLVFCGDKSVLDVDVLIDDTPRHFERFKGTPVLYSAPHNRHERRYRRVSSWNEVRRMFLGAAGGSGRSSTGSPSGRLV
jgi:5'(3')-deoxyribonucleotidase/uncharacterized protein with PQ loop repeat